MKVPDMGDSLLEIEWNSKLLEGRRITDLKRYSVTSD